MNELFEQSSYLISSDLEIETKNTPEEEAFQLASVIFPIKANSLQKPTVVTAERLTFERKNIISLAHYINEYLKEEDITEAAKRLCEDYNPISMEQDEIIEIWFDTEGMKNFLKWCEPREKTLFD